MIKNKYLLFLVLFTTYLFVFFITSCESSFDVTKIIKKQRNYDRFQDGYSDFTYENSYIGFRIEFDGGWTILTQYSNFDGFQKNYAEIFYTELSEVLFIGYHSEKKIGVRATNERLSIPSEQYIKNVKQQNAGEISKYKIEFVEEKKIEFDKFEAINLIYNIAINHINVFIFDTIVFKNFENNLKLEFWVENSEYEENKEYFNQIFNSISFKNPEIIVDQTTDMDLTNDSE